MTLENKTILILDDDHVVRESFIAHFEDRDWNILSAVTGEEALEILKTNTPDCAIVDIRLPGIDGNEFILRAAQIQPNMQCVICTGSPEYDVPKKISALKAVSNKVYSKPVTNIAKIEAHLLSLLK